MKKVYQLFLAGQVGASRDIRISFTTESNEQAQSTATRKRAVV